MENLNSAPPENVFSMLNNPVFSFTVAKTDVSTPGTGIKDPTR
jgi:hypothetical protein